MVCIKICNDCPFSNKSIRGWLADYSVNDIVDFQSNEAFFPCHKMMTENNLSQEDVRSAIMDGKMKLCRGYVESIIKSAKSPKFNSILKEAITIVKAQGLSKESMAIWDFIKHHEKNGNDKQ